jgi:hypothetical protein
MFLGPMYIGTQIKEKLMSYLDEYTPFTEFFRNRFAKKINNLALKDEVVVLIMWLHSGLNIFLTALKFARESVQRVLNPSARINSERGIYAYESD